ncbi:hypothetical protein JCM11491_006503 [Sporobolomyces phaffii]
MHAAESAQLTTTAEDNNLAPPRLPSISCLLNSIPPPLDRSPDDVTPSQERHGSIPSLTVERTDSAASPSLALPVPPPPAPQLPSSTDYPYPLPYEHGPRGPIEDVRPPSAAASPRTYSPTASQTPAHNFGNRSFYPPSAQHAPTFDSFPPQYDPGSMDLHRQRSASFNAFQPYPPPSQSLPSPYPGRPYPGFATSSERRSSGSDERGMSHGGLGPWRNRRRGPESPYDGSGHSLPPPAQQTQPQHPPGQWLQPNSYSPTRPRALSISTADEYYAGRPAWSTVPPSMGPPPPLHHLDPSQRRSESDPYPMEYFHRPFPPSNSFNRAAPLSAGVSNDFSYLRLGSGDYSRNHLLQNVPPALPIPPPLAPTPTDAHPDLRPIVLPSGLAGSAPSSAGSTSTSHFSAHSGNGLPTPLSAGPASSLPSPSTSAASTSFDLNGSGQNDERGDASGSSENGKYCCPHCCGTSDFDRRNSADMEDDEDQDAEGERDD